MKYKRSGLSNNRAGLHKELGFLVLIFLMGCNKLYYAVDDGWECRRVHVDGKHMIICDEERSAFYGKPHDTYRCEEIDEINGTNDSNN